MKIDTLKQLKELVAVCREAGVNIIKVDGIELVLEGTPQPKAKRQRKNEQAVAPGGITAETEVPVANIPDIATPDALTEEQLLNWSVGGNPN